MRVNIHKEVTITIELPIAELDWILRAVTHYNSQIPRENEMLYIQSDLEQALEDAKR